MMRKGAQRGAQRGAHDAARVVGEHPVTVRGASNAAPTTVSTVASGCDPIGPTFPFCVTARTTCDPRASAPLRTHSDEMMSNVEVAVNGLMQWVEVVPVEARERRGRALR